MRDTTNPDSNETNPDNNYNNSDSIEYKKFRQNGSVPGLYYRQGNMPEQSSSKGDAYHPREVVKTDQTEENYDDDDDEQKSDYNSAAQNLPPEVLIEVFSHLPPSNLDPCSLVCKHWYEVLSNDASWRASFERIFLSKDFNRVTPSLKWRTELVSRLDYIHKWRKGNMKNVSFNGQVREITDVFPDLGSCRVVLFSTILGAGVIADPTKGKLANPRIFTEKAMTLTSDCDCVDGSRFGMLYGMADGRVCSLLFSQETRIHDYIVMKDYRHVGEVTAVWINKIESPRDNDNDKRQFFGALSGGMDGKLVSWDLEQGRMVQEYSVTPAESPSPIIHIKCDHLRNKVVVISQAGRVYYASFEPEVPNNGKFVEIGQFEPVVPLEWSELTQSDRLSFFDVDFMSGHAIYANKNGIYRFKLVTEYEEMETACFHLKGSVVTVAVDSTVVPEAGSNKDTPGKNQRFIAASTENDLIYVWILQGEAVYKDTQDKRAKPSIQPLRVSPSPFQVEVSTLPGVTAIALNSLVLLVGSYNGVTIAYELLTGEFLRVVSTRFSKKALNLRTNNNFAQPGLFPITKLEIDSDPANPHGIIVVGSAVQYFDLGANIDSKKKLGIHKKRKGAPAYSNNNSDLDKTQIHRDIVSDMEQMRIEDAEVQEVREHNEKLQAMFNTEGLSDDDQLQYALMLSQDENHEKQQQHQTWDLSTATKNDVEGDHEEDEELKRAIDLSLEESSSPPPYEKNRHELDDHEDEELKRAVMLSLEEENQQPQQSSSAYNEHPELDGIEDEDLKRAILLSLNDK